MRKRVVSWMASLLSVAVFVCMVTLPQSTNAKGNKKVDLEKDWANSKKMQAIHQIKNLKNEKKQMLNRIPNRQKQAQTKASQTKLFSSVTYKGKVDGLRIDEYVFHVAKTSQMDIEVLHPEENEIEYIVLNEFRDSYNSGDTLPAGTYHFLVTSMSEDKMDYYFEISGLEYEEAPDTNVPDLQLTNPASKRQRFPLGATSITLKGVTDTETGVFLLNEDETDQPVAILNDSFSEEIPMKPGVNVMGLIAVETSGNAVYDIYTPGIGQIKRLGGADRFGVSANVSKEIGDQFENFFGDPETILLARGDVFSDALSGTPLSFLNGFPMAPVLLTQSTSLPESVKKEIKNHKPERVIILGGEDSISPKVVEQLLHLGIGGRIDRIEGKNRFDVSAEAARFLIKKKKQDGMTTDTAIIANGLIWPDAVSISSVAANLGMPILLVKNDELPTEIESFLETHPKVRNFIIVGGPASISDKVEQTLRSMGGEVDRIEGKNRFEVAVEIANYFDLDPTAITLARADGPANGKMFADALSGGPLAAVSGYTWSPSPIMLTLPIKIPIETQEYVDQYKDYTVSYYVLGSEGSISKGLYDKLASYLRSE